MTELEKKPGNNGEKMKNEILTCPDCGREHCNYYPSDVGVNFNYKCPKMLPGMEHIFHDGSQRRWHGHRDDMEGEMKKNVFVALLQTDSGGGRRIVTEKWCWTVHELFDYISENLEAIESLGSGFTAKAVPAEACFFFKEKEEK